MIEFKKSLDEPFSAVDRITWEQLQEELIQLQDEAKRSIIFDSHGMEL